MKTIKVISFLVFAALCAVSVSAAEDPNEAAVDSSVTYLTASFAGLYVLGVGVVIAVIARDKFMRRTLE